VVCNGDGSAVACSGEARSAETKRFVRTKAALDDSDAFERRGWTSATVLLDTSDVLHDCVDGRGQR
jgi:hypothetical protein